jgi:hypothetical protein
VTLGAFTAPLAWRWSKRWRRGGGGRVATFWAHNRQDIGIQYRVTSRTVW